jgi:pyrophosphatase PpaX
MQHIRTILFDIDGTLLDTREFILQAFEHALSTYGFPHLRRADFAHRVGSKGLIGIYRDLTGLEDVGHFAEAHRAFQGEHLDLAHPFGETHATLETLASRGFIIAAVTTRSSVNAGATLKGAGIDGYFSALITADDVTNLKPHPEPLLKALGIIGKTAQDAVMVGDTDADIQAGKNAGAFTIGATYGFQDAARLRAENPDALIDDIGHLPHLFERQPTP